MEPEAQVEFIANDGHGLNGSSSVASHLLKVGDFMGRRPYASEDGSREYMPVWNGKFDDEGNRTYEAKLVNNAGAVLRKNEWEYLDSVLVDIARPRLQLINAMRAAGLSVSFQDAYNHSIYQYERVSDIDDAVVSMSAKSNQGNDRSTVDIQSIPLPLIHKTFSLEAREIAIARKTGQRLPTHMLQLCGRKVAEAADKLVLGTYGTYSFNSQNLYGLTNFPGRNTGSFLNPSVGGWTPAMLYNSVIDMLKRQLDDNQFGTFDLFYSTGLMTSMLRQFSSNYDGGSLLENISRLPMLGSVQMLDTLTGNQLLLVKRDPLTASVLMGMDLRVVQWNTDGGETINFRVMAMMLPLLRTDQLGNSGIVHFTGNATTV